MDREVDVASPDGCAQNTARARAASFYLSAEPLARRQPAHRPPSLDALGIFASILILRLALIGLPPHADEGFYAAQSYFLYLAFATDLFAPHSVLPPFSCVTGPELYALLRSWIFAVPREPFLLLRLIDAIVAAGAAMLAYNYLRLATGWPLAAWVATALAAVGMNHPAFIEAGARNPIAFATLLLIASLYLLERAAGKRPLWPALFLAGAVLAREPFAAAAAVVTAYVWYCWGFKSAAKLAGLAALFGVLAVFAIAALKGGQDGAVAMYHAYAHGALSSPEVNSYLLGRIRRAIHFGWEAATLVAVCAPALALGLLAPLLDTAYRTRRALSLYLLGVALMLAPGVEIAIKTSYAYHYAQGLLGGAIVMTYGVHLFLRRLSEIRRRHRGAAVAVLGTFVVVQVALLGDYARTMYYSAQWSRHFAPVTIRGDWSSPAVNDSYFLKVASIVRGHTGATDRVLSTSDVVYPLARRAPATRASASLGCYYVNRPAAAEVAALLDLLRRTRPAVFVDEYRNALDESSERTRFMAPFRELFAHSDYVDVGPGLRPYRLFRARVYLDPPQPARDTGAAPGPGGAP